MKINKIDDYFISFILILFQSTLVTHGLSSGEKLNWEKSTSLIVNGFIRWVC